MLSTALSTVLVLAGVPVVRVQAAEPPAAARALARVDSLLAVGQTSAAAAEALGAVRRWRGDALYGWQVEGRAGAALVAAGRPGEALEHLEAAVGAQPGEATLRHQLGLALTALGRRGRALAEFDEAARLEPAAVAPRLEAGRLRSALGDAAGARLMFETASLLCGGCPEADRLLASALLAAGEPAAAVGPLRRLWAAGADEEVRTHLVAALAGAGEDSSLLRLVQARGLEAWTADEWRQALQAEGRLGGFELAELALGCLENPALAPGLPRSAANFWARAAANLQAAGRYENALAAIDRAVGLAPADSRNHHNRAAALAALGRFDEARRALVAAGADSTAIGPKGPR